MKTDVLKLRDVAKEKGVSFETIAQRIGIDPSTFYRKVNAGGEKFTIAEVHKMVESIPMTKAEAVSIFLSENSQ